ncbi:hypothetical protein HBB16_06555 [Pseudonocardia sp. MCCB 268]|nr:hypothetical protein [Pseudonocardia cytotoxica]
MATVDEAVALLAELGPDAAPLAGATWVMRAGQGEPCRLHRRRAGPDRRAARDRWGRPRHRRRDDDARRARGPAGPTGARRSSARPRRCRRSRRSATSPRSGNPRPRLRRRGRPRARALLALTPGTSAAAGGPRGDRPGVLSWSRATRPKSWELTTASRA